MKSEIEAARARQGQTAELAAEARDAREKLDHYESDSEGAQMRSPGRMRDLQQESEAADLRLERLQSAPPEPAGGEAEASEEAADAGTDDDDADGGVRA